MKKILILVPILAVLLWAQSRENYTVQDLFDNSAATVTSPSWTPADSITVDANGIYWLTTTDTTDTLISAKIYLGPGGNDITAYVEVDSIGDGLRTFAYFGYYRGPERGWVWTLIDSLKTDNAEATFNVGSQTWGPYEVLEEIGIKLEEKASASNKYAVRIKHFKWR